MHDDARPDPVVGIYLRAGTLREAERAAADAWTRATAAEPWLRQWPFLRAAVPLLPDPTW
ncbi:hypothetical protein ACGFXC_14825 [Streptomyces sp. NPDC048507]|uniref:hypothetical protein n=1 Tax=Streptomyces sp. NPDC048507 TaxID=3365560 RepID=UPI0037191D41